MAAGKAIVCPDIAGIAELFRDEHDGLLYPPGDSAALGRQLKRVTGDRGLAEGLAKSARERAVREFGLDQFARRCEDVFSRVLA
jgi:glycosyltransferase involved in cell wall biosynthesis